MGQNNGNNNGVDLSGALGSSDTGVKFKDSDWSANKYYKEPATPKIIRLVIKYSGGLVKDEKQANYVLLGFVALAIIISLIVVFMSFSAPDIQKNGSILPPPAHIQI